MASDKRTYVFVHGSWHGAWCWFKLLPRLEAHGHRAIALDLPGHGTAWQPAHEVTLDAYVTAVASVLDQQPEPVVLVGHSRAGIVISQVAELRPAKIAHLVYLAAFLIPHGESMLDTATTDSESLIVANLVFDDAAGSHMLRREAFRQALYGDCSAEDVALASHLLTPEPNAPVGTKLDLGEGYRAVPKTYIECRQDRGVSPRLQRRMQERVGVDRQLSLDTSHSPFFSAPEALATLLESV